MDRDGTVYDFFDGVKDAEAGRIRFVGDPDERIQEDALRILRFFRFYAYYGLVTPDAAGLEACRRHAVFIFLIVFLGLAIANKKRLWAQIK